MKSPLHAITVDVTHSGWVHVCFFRWIDEEKKTSHQTHATIFPAKPLADERLTRYRRAQDALRHRVQRHDHSSWL